MALYVISDTHLSFGVQKPMDIFAGWSDYTQRLKKNWETLVSPTDTVVLPGDISWGMNLEEAKKDFTFLNSLPGTKIIGKGNHDYWWETMKKMRAFAQKNNFDTIKFLFNNAYELPECAVCGTRGWFFEETDEGAEKIIAREASRLNASVNAAELTGKEPVVFMHYPVVYENAVCEEILSVLENHEIRRCYFGHIHGEKTGKYEDYLYKNIRFSLISADFLKFCPKKIML